MRPGQRRPCLRTSSCKLAGAYVIRRMGRALTRTHFAPREWGTRLPSQLSHEGSPPGDPMRLDMLHPHARAVWALAVIVAVAVACQPAEMVIPDIDIDWCPNGTAGVATIRVQPAEANLRIGATLMIEAMPLDARGQPVFCAPPMDLVSTNPSVATVSGSRVVTGVSAGKAFIRATSGGRSDSVAVTVVSTTLATLTIEAPASLLVGQ